MIRRLLIAHGTQPYPPVPVPPVHGQRVIGRTPDVNGLSHLSHLSHPVYTPLPKPGKTYRRTGGGGRARRALGVGRVGHNRRDSR